MRWVDLYSIKIISVKTNVYRHYSWCLIHNSWIAERMPGFNRLRMSEVKYFHCSIILHSDVTIFCCFQLIHHCGVKVKVKQSPHGHFSIASSHCILRLCRLCIRSRLMRAHCHCHCKWPYVEEYQISQFPRFLGNFHACANN